MKQLSLVIFFICGFLFYSPAALSSSEEEVSEAEVPKQAARKEEASAVEISRQAIREEECE